MWVREPPHALDSIYPRVFPLGRLAQGRGAPGCTPGLGDFRRVVPENPLENHSRITFFLIEV